MAPNRSDYPDDISFWCAYRMWQCKQAHRRSLRGGR